MQTGTKKTLDFDAKIYRAEAVQKAAYKLSDRLHFHIEPRDGEGGVRVTMSPRQEGDIEFLAGEFCNEVLDQELREVVAEETRPVRDVLMAQAFSAVSLVDEKGDEGDYVEDTKEIRGRKNKMDHDAASDGDGDYVEDTKNIRGRKNKTDRDTASDGERG